MKKLILSLFSFFLCFTGAMATACGEEVKAEIKVTSDSFESEGLNNYIELCLNEDSSNSSATIYAEVSNVNDGRVKVSNSYENIVSVSADYKANLDQSIITITGVSEGIAEVFVNSYTGSADPVKITVYVYSDIMGMAQHTDIDTKNTQFVEKGNPINLNSGAYLDFTSRVGGESNRKDVDWFFESDSGVKTDELKVGDTVVAKIQDGMLTVNDSYTESTISILAESRYTEYRAIVTLTVLEALPSESIALTYTRSDSAGLTSFDSFVGEGSDEILLVRNNDANVNSKFYINVNIDCPYDFDIVPVVYDKAENGTVLSNCLIVTQESHEGNNYYFCVKGVWSSVSYDNVYLTFGIVYKDYELTIPSAMTKIALSDVVNQMIIYSDDKVVDGINSIDVYNNYATGIAGKTFDIQLKPSTVKPSLAKYRIIVSTTTEEPVTTDLLEVYYGEEVLLFRQIGSSSQYECIFGEENTFENNSSVSFKVTEAACNVNAAFEVTFEAAQATSVTKKLTFNSVKAPSESDFECTDTTEYLATNTYKTVTVKTEIGGITSTTGLYLDYDKTLPITVSELNYDSETNEISFNVTNEELNFAEVIDFTIKHENGMTCVGVIKCEAFIPLESAKIVLDNSTASGVAKYAYNDTNSLSDLSLAIGTSIKLNYVISGAYTEISVVSPPTGAYSETSRTLTSDTSTYNTLTQILTASNTPTGETGQKYIFTFVGYNELHTLTAITKEFSLEVFVPVTTLNLNLKASEQPVQLIAQDSISAEDYNLATKHIEITLRRDTIEPKYNEYEYFSVSSAIAATTKNLTGENLSFNGTGFSYSLVNFIKTERKISFDIVVNSTNGFSGFTDTLSIKYKKYNILIETEIKMTVSNATRVNSVVWENEDDSIYLDMTSRNTKENTAVIITSIKPSEAYNSNLEYIFIADVGTDNSLVKISNRGVVSIKSGAVAGGTGYIYVLPEDAVKKDSVSSAERKINYYTKNGNIYEAHSVAISELADAFDELVANAYFIDGVENNATHYSKFADILLKIRVIVADGRSQATALRIYSIAELKNIFNTNRLDLHYVLMNDLTLTDWNPDSDVKLSASIRGYTLEESTTTKGSRSNITITFTGASSSFVNEISESGEIADLSFVGEVGSNGFVTTTNNGTISNITIDINVTESSISSSTVYGGAIAGTNNGTISNTCALGVTVSGENAGGLVATNTGTIKDSYVEIYQFTSSVSSITATGIAGGIAGKSSGIITGCYVYDYSVDYTTTNGAHITGATVGALVGSATGTIENSFAVVGFEDFVGEGSATIKDCYTSYYNGSDYTTNLTETRSDYWLNGEGIVAYVNGGYAHLKFYQDEKFGGVSGLAVEDIAGQSLKVDGENAILMVKNITTSKTLLTNAQLTKLNNYNKVEIKDLFGVNANQIVAQSNNEEVVSATGSALQIKAKGSAKLTIYSKKDLSQKKEIEIIVIDSIIDFTNDSTNNEIYVQEKHSKTLNYAIVDSIYLGSQSYQLSHDTYTLTSTIDPSTGVNVSVSDFAVSIAASENSQGDYTLTTKLSVIGLSGDYQSAVNSKYTSDIDVNVFKGATYIGLSSDTLPVYPASQSKLVVTLKTDSTSDDIILNLKAEDGNTLLTSDSVYYYGNTAIFEITKTNSVYADGKIVFTLMIDVVDTYKYQVAEQQNYKLYITSKTGTATNEGECVDIMLMPQTINHIDISNYLVDYPTYRNSRIEYVRKHQLVSTISPGTSTIMEIGIDPKYAYYTYFTITAYNNETILNITKLSQDTSSYLNYYADAKMAQYLTNNIGLKITPENREAEQYFFKLYAPTTIKSDSIVPVTITFYGDNNEVIKSTVYQLAISYQKPAELIVNENKNSTIAKGGSADILVNVGADQTLYSLTLSGIQYATIDNLEGPFEYADGTRYYTAKISTSIIAASTSDNTSNFLVKAQVARTMNGLLEIEETQYEMTLVDFSIKSTTEDVTASIEIEDEFDVEYIFDPLNYDAFGEAYNTEKATLNALRDTFTANGYCFDNYRTDGFGINYTHEGAISIMNRLFIENGNSQTALAFNQSSTDENVYIADCDKFVLKYNKSTNKLYIKGTATTSSPIILRLDNQIYTNRSSNTYNTISMYYNISVKVYTDEDKPTVISSANDFLKIQENETAENYILSSDIELVDYKPFNTRAIASLDGNGYTIHITSFNTEGSNSIELGLFTTVESDTILKNIRVNYYYGGNISLDVGKNGYSNIDIAGLAITNSGIITNCEVVSYNYTSAYATTPSKGIEVKYMHHDTSIILTASHNVTSNIAGFVLTNNGSITNSRVGGETTTLISGSSSATNVKAEEITIDTFNISGQGTISGFVGSNSSVVTSSYAKNIQVTNNSNNIKYYTAGFAGSNSGRISASFVEGTKSGDTSTMYALSGTSVSSKGYVAGFIATNTGIISDSYSNIALNGGESSQANYFSAGFVYTNTGKITTSYSSSKIQNNNVTQTAFSGVDVKGDSLNTGTIYNCYYNGMLCENEENTESLIDTGAVMATSPQNTSQYYGFAFASSLTATDGIWFIRSNQTLTLCAPNQIAISHRACIETSVKGVYNFPYATINGDDEYCYGGEHNPIIIKSSEDFEQAMGGADEATNIGKKCMNDTISGSYRFVKDIDFSELNSDKGVAVVKSIEYKFTGRIDGNGFTISNISLGSSVVSNNLNSLGLFSVVEGTESKTASIINLNLEILSITATNTPYVGSLAGMVKYGSLINISVEQILPSTNQTEITSDDDTKYGVHGNNIVGGVVGGVFGESKIYNIDVTNPIVSAAYYHADHNSVTTYGVDSTIFDVESIRNDESNVSNISFAGGAIGYIDVYTSSTKSEYIYTGSQPTDDKYSINKIKINNSVNVSGEIVGGAIGYVGNHTSVIDSSVEISNANYKTNILSYNQFAGGVIGYSAGCLKGIYAEYDKETQTTIENSIANYYNGSTSAERGALDIFTVSDNTATSTTYSYKPLYIGGLIGFVRTGRLSVSYNKLNVINTTEGCIVGGIIGLIGTAMNGDSFSETDYGDFALNDLNGMSQKETTINSTFTLREVYASGDIKGGKITGLGKGTAGGIVGEISSYTPTEGSAASVSFNSVNAVNELGIYDYGSEEFKLTDGTYSTSAQGIYALVANVTGTAQINSIKNAASSEAEYTNVKSNIGIFDYYKYNTIPIYVKSINLENNTKIEEFKSNTFKIDSLHTVTSGEVGYRVMNRAFLGSGNWTLDNWEHPNTQVYPSIQLIVSEQYVYLDATNILYALKRVTGTSKELRVRGLTEDGEGYVSYINLAHTDFSSYIPLKNFSGKITGGWDKEGKQTMLKNWENCPTLILNGALLDGDSIGVDVTVSDIKVVYANGGNDYTPSTLNEDNNKLNSLTARDGGLIVSGAVNRASFANMEIDLRKVTNNITIDGEARNNNGFAGIICSEAISSSFENITIYTTKTINFNFANAVGKTFGENIYAGLITGKLSQQKANKTAVIKDIKVENHVNANDLMQVKLGSNVIGTDSDVYVGGFIGQVENKTSLTVSGIHSIIHLLANGTNEDDADTTKISFVSDSNNPEINSVYIGGMYGDITSQSGSDTKVNVKDKDYTSPHPYKTSLEYIATKKLFMGSVAGHIFAKEVAYTAQNQNLDSNTAISIDVDTNIYVGAVFGKVESDNASKIELCSVKNTINESTELTTGSINMGVIGEASTGVEIIVYSTSSENITSNISFNTTNTTGTAMVNVGAIIGKANGGTFSLENENKQITSTITITSSGTKAGMNIGGLTGDTRSLNAWKVTNAGKIASTITLTNNGTITTANIGGVAGIVGASNIEVDNVDKIESKIELSSTSTTAGTITTLNSGLVFGAISSGTSTTASGTATSAGTVTIAEISLGVSGKIINLERATPVSKQNTITESNLGGLVGINAGNITIGTESTNVTMTLQIGSKDDNSVIDPIDSNIAYSYNANKFATAKAYVGGFIGNSTGEITIYGGSLTSGKITEKTGDTLTEKTIGSEIALSTSDATNVDGSDETNVGGIVGLTTAAFTQLRGSQPFINNGTFFIENSSTTTATTIFGGVVGQFNSATSDFKIGITDDDTDVFVTSNLYANVKNLIAGGVVGQITSARIVNIYDTVYGGAVKSFGAYSNDGTHVFGGIVGKVAAAATGTTKEIKNNYSYGDDIVTYNDENQTFTGFSSYIFGGIIGINQGLSVQDNYSLTTCNNDRIADTKDDRQAIVGSGTNGTSTGGNFYSHSVCLTVDSNGTDIGYKTSYSSTNRGYVTCGTTNMVGTEESIFTFIKDIKVKGVAVINPGLGHKLNPQVITADTETASDQLNGVAYFVMDDDYSTISEPINIDATKVALIGDARVLKYEGDSSYEGALSFYKNTLTQNEFISSMNLTIDISDDNGDTKGGLVNQMTGGQIYAVALAGELSVGGNSAIDLAPVVGQMAGGLIDETNSSVNVIYRAAATGDVAGFVTFASGYSGTPVFIRNSYSTGTVSSYISANVYAFTDGNSTNKDEISIKECYTISKLDKNDYTTADNPSGTLGVFGDTTTSDCWYDSDALQATVSSADGVTAYKFSETGNKAYTLALGYNTGDTSDSKWEGQTDKTGWIRNKNYNYGYATRNFGYLKQSSYAVISATTYENWISDNGDDNGDTLTGTETTSEGTYAQVTNTYERLSWDDYTTEPKHFIVPNYGKLLQIIANTIGGTGTDKDYLNGNYVLTEDIDLSKVSVKTLFSSSTFSGTFDGQEHTISNGTSSMFNTISGTVMNLRLTDFDGGATAIGTILAATNNGTINNVVVSGFASQAGLVATNNGNIYNSKSYVDISGTAEFVGGIAGSNDDAASIIVNCINYGPIETKCTTIRTGAKIVAGGIVGSNSGTIYGCGNTNSVLAGYTNSTTSVSYAAGGIAGESSNTIKNCYNTAMVKAGNKSSTTASYAGGIVGFGSTTGTYSDLYNSGVIEALGKNLTAFTKSGDTGNTIIANSSTGEITITVRDAINVYSDGLIGSIGFSNSSSSSGRNEGTVIRNGVYNTGDINKNEKVSFPNGTYINGFHVGNVTVKNYQVYICDYDDLGYPKSFCLTAKRSINIGNAVVYIVGDNTTDYSKWQTIISNTKTLSNSYYDLGKTTTASGTELTDNSNVKKLMASSDNSDDSSENIIKINDKNYQITTNKTQFNTVAAQSVKEETITIAKNTFEGYFTNPSYQNLKNSGYKFTVNPGDVLSTVSNAKHNNDDIGSTNVNVNIFNVTSITETADNFTFKIYYALANKLESSNDITSATVNFTYKITAYKDDETGNVTVDSSNLIKDGNTYYLYLENQKNKPESDSEKYIVKFGSETITDATWDNTTQCLSFTYSGTISAGTMISYSYNNNTEGIITNYTSKLLNTTAVISPTLDVELQKDKHDYVWTGTCSSSLTINGGTYNNGDGITLNGKVYQIEFYMDGSGNQSLKLNPKFSSQSNINIAMYQAGTVTGSIVLPDGSHNWSIHWPNGYESQTITIDGTAKSNGEKFTIGGVEYTATASKNEISSTEYYPVLILTPTNAGSTYSSSGNHKAGETGTSTGTITVEGIGYQWSINTTYVTSASSELTYVNNNNGSYTIILASEHYNFTHKQTDTETQKYINTTDENGDNYKVTYASYLLSGISEGAYISSISSITSNNVTDTGAECNKADHALQLTITVSGVTEEQIKNTNIRIYTVIVPKDVTKNIDGLTVKYTLDSSSPSETDGTSCYYDNTGTSNKYTQKYNLSSINVPAQTFTKDATATPIYVISDGVNNPTVISSTSGTESCSSTAITFTYSTKPSSNVAVRTYEYYVSNATPSFTSNNITYTTGIDSNKVTTNTKFAITQREEVLKFSWVNTDEEGEQRNNSITSNAGKITIGGTEYICYSSTDGSGDEADTTFILISGNTAISSQVKTDSNDIKYNTITISGTEFTISNSTKETVKTYQYNSNRTISSSDSTNTSNCSYSVSDGKVVLTITPPSGVMCYSYEIAVTGLTGDTDNITSESVKTESYNIPHNAYKDKVYISQSNENSEELTSTQKTYTDKATAKIDNNQVKITSGTLEHTYTITTKYKVYKKEGLTLTSSFTKSTTTFAGMIIKGDINLGAAIGQYSFENQVISGNGYFVNYYIYNKTQYDSSNTKIVDTNINFISTIKNTKITNLSIGANFIANKNEHNYSLFVYSVSTDSSISNVSIYGAMSIIGDPIRTSYLLTSSKESNENIKDNSSYANYSAFCDVYTSSTYSVDFNKISINYGVIVGFDGADGATGCAGNEGQSFTLALTNNGLIKAGNGGNGGRGSDGNIGADSTNSTAPTAGGEGTSGGNAGSGGTVTTNNSSQSNNKNGLAGQNGYKGNTGHGGLWLYKNTVNGGDDSCMSSKLPKQTWLDSITYNVYYNPSTINVTVKTHHHTTGGKENTYWDGNGCMCMNAHAANWTYGETTEKAGWTKAYLNQNIYLYGYAKMRYYYDFPNYYYGFKRYYEYYILVPYDTTNGHPTGVDAIATDAVFAG